MRLQVLNISEIDTGRWKRWQDLLSEGETARALRYRLAVDRKSFVAGRGVVRERVAAATGVPAAAVEILTSDKGKPYVKGFQDVFQFSISHDNEYLAVLWHSGPEPVGVDIQKVDEGFDYSVLAGRYFSGQEQRQIHSVWDFFKYWTRKEALLKALGSGLVDDMKAVAVDQSLVTYPGGALHLTTYCSDRAVLSCAIPQGLPLPAAPDQPEKFILAF